MAAHLHGARFQALMSLCGSSGEAAFRESLRAQYTTERHDAKGLRTYYISGTCGTANIRRIISSSRKGNHITCIGKTVPGVSGGPLCITVSSNARCWIKNDLSGLELLVDLNLEMDRLAEIPKVFLFGCRLHRMRLASLAIEEIPNRFMNGCLALKEVDLSSRQREKGGGLLLNQLFCSH